MFANESSPDHMSTEPLSSARLLLRHTLLFPDMNRVLSVLITAKLDEYESKHDAICLFACCEFSTSADHAAFVCFPVCTETETNTDLLKYVPRLRDQTVLTSLLPQSMNGRPINNKSLVSSVFQHRAFWRENHGTAVKSKRACGLRVFCFSTTCLHHFISG